MTGWVMLGLEAAGSNPLDLRRGGETPVVLPAQRTPTAALDGDLERTILALAGAGLDPRGSAAPTGRRASLAARRNGSVGGQVN